MKGILGLLRQKLPPEERKEAGESVFFSTAFADHGISADETVPWEARAVEVGAKRLNAEKGAPKLQALWARDPHMKRLDSAAMDQLNPKVTNRKIGMWPVCLSPVLWGD